MPTRAAYRSWVTPFGCFEACDPAGLWQLVCTVCRQTVQGLKTRDRVALCGIAVSSIGCAAVCVGADGHVLYPLQLGDTAPALFETYRREMGADRYYRMTGYPLESDNTAFQLARLRELDPLGYEQIAAVLSVADYINLKLTGLRAREFSTAASMALWNYRDGTWWQEFLAAIELGPDVMGHPVPSGQLLGPVTAYAARETGWREGTPVYLGGHDYLCAALAAGCITPGVLVNVSGTFDIIAAFQNTAQPPPHRAEHRTIVDHHVVADVYSLMTEAVGGGQAEWLRRGLLAPGADGDGGMSLVPWERLLDEIATLPPPFTDTCEIFMPHVFGQWSPARRDTAQGAYVGLTDNTTSASFLRATILGVCFQARHMIDALRPIIPDMVGPLRVVGGGSRHPVWMQLKADTVGMALSAPRVHEASALGAALLAGVGAGVYGGYDEAGAVSAGLGADIYEPAPGTRALYDDMYHTVYLFLLGVIRQVDERLNRVVAPH